MRRAWTVDVGLAWLRILTGVGIALHGSGKVFGGTMDHFAQGVAQMGFPLPVLFAWAAALSEFVGGVCLVAGLGTRIAAFFAWCTMSAALFLRHAHDPFSVKELAYLYWTMLSALVWLGGGRYTIRQLFKGGTKSGGGT